MDGHPGSPPLIGAGAGQNPAYRPAHRRQPVDKGQSGPATTFGTRDYFRSQSRQHAALKIGGSSWRGKPARRSWGSGSLTWLTSTRVRLRVRVDGDVHSKTVRVTHRDHGGRRQAEAALEAYRAEIEHRPSAMPAPRSDWTLRSLMADYIASRARTGKSRAPRRAARTSPSGSRTCWRTRR